MTTPPTPTRPDAASPSSQPLQRAVSSLVDDANAVRAAAVAFEGSAVDAEHHYAEEVSATLALLEIDLTLARGALATQLADNSDELHDSVKELADAARGWLDGLQVQADLGRMNARDRAGELTRRIEHSAAAIRRVAATAAESVGGDLSEVRRSALDGIHEIRRAVADTANALRATTREDGA